MFTPIGYFAPTGVAPGPIVTASLEQWLDVTQGSEAAALTDQSGNGRNATNNGGGNITYNTGTKVFDIACTADGQYIDTAYEPAWTSDWTIEIWAKMTSVAGAGGISLVGNRESAGTDFYIVSANETNGKIETYWIDAANVADISPTPSASYFDGSYHHIVAVNDSATLRLYVDTTEIGTFSVSGFGAPSNGNNLSLMGNYLTKYWDDANMGSYRVYSAALSPSEITQNYNAEKAHYGL